MFRLFLCAAAFVVVPVSLVARGDDEVRRVDLDGNPLPEHAVARFGTLNWTHSEGDVSGLAWSPDGKRLAGWSDDAITIWDSVSGREVTPEPLRKSRNGGAAWSPDGKRLVVWTHVVGEGPRLRVVDSSTGATERELGRGEKSWQRALWSRDGKWIAASFIEDELELTGKVVVWNARTGEEHFSVAQGFLSWDLSPDGKQLATYGAADGEWSVKLYDIEKKQETARAEPRAPARLLTFFPDGKRLAIGTFDVWHFADGGKVEAVGAPNLIDLDRRFEFTPDGMRAVHLYAFSEVDIVDAGSRERVASPKTGSLFTSTVACSPDGKLLAIPADDRIAFYDLTRDEFRDDGAHWVSADSIRLAPDGRTVISAGRDAVRIWDTATARQSRSIPVGGRVAPAPALETTRDGKTLILARKGSRNIELQEMATGKSLGELRSGGPPVVAMARVPASNVLLSLHVAMPERDSDDPPDDVAPPVIRAWDLDNRRMTVEIAAPGWLGESAFGNRSVLVPSNDGRKLALAGLSSRGLLRDGPWHRAEVYATPEIRAEPKPALEEAMISLESARGFPTVAFSPDGHRIAGPWGRAGTVVLADIKSGEMKRIEYTKYEVVTAVAWSPNGKLVAAASVRTNPPDRGLQIDVWSVESGAIVQELVGHAAPIGDLAFTPDGKRLLSGSADTTLLLWDLSLAREKLAAERKVAERDD